jgi:hypothetical protein
VSSGSDPSNEADNDPEAKSKHEKKHSAEKRGEESDSFPRRHDEPGKHKSSKSKSKVNGGTDRERPYSSFISAPTRVLARTPSDSSLFPS